MNKLRNNPFIATQLCSLLLGMVFIVASAQAQAPPAAANDNRSEATRAQAFAPRYRLSLVPAGFRLMPTASTRTGVGSRSTGISLMPMAAGPNLQVLGGGTLGRLTKWTGFTSSNSFIGNSTIFEDKFGNVGIGTDTPTSKLTVQGMIETTLGGLKFPDGTVQTTSATGALFSVAHDATLNGNGTSALPLGVSVPLFLSGGTGRIIEAYNTNADTDPLQPHLGIVGRSIEWPGVLGRSQGDSIAFIVFRGVGVQGQGADRNAASGGPGVLALGGEGGGAGNTGGIGIEAIAGGGADGATPGLAGKFRGDVQITGNTLVTSAGKGIILKSPDGATCRLLSIDNAGNIVLTAVTCP